MGLTFRKFEEEWAVNWMGKESVSVLEISFRETAMANNESIEQSRSAEENVSHPQETGIPASSSSTTSDKDIQVDHSPKKLPKFRILFKESK